MEAAQRGAARRAAGSAGAQRQSRSGRSGDRREPRRRRQGAMARHGAASARISAACRSASRATSAAGSAPATARIRYRGPHPPRARRRRTWRSRPTRSPTTPRSASAEARETGNAARATFPATSRRSRFGRWFDERLPIDAARLRQLRRLSDPAQPELLVHVRRHPGVHAGRADRDRRRARHALRGATQTSPSSRSRRSCAT